MKSFAIAGAVAALATTVAADLPAIEIKGSKFYYSNNGTQFFMRGVAYQQDYSGAGSGTVVDGQTYTDPLADASACARDIPYLQQLNTNTIRVYAVNPAENHDSCMAALANAGIYVVADLGAPVEGESLNRDTPEWTDSLYTRYTNVIDSLQNYTNVIGFFAGNEVSNAPNNTDAAAFVKAAVRDTKAYIKAKGYRSIGVGYATSDDQYIRVNIGEYMNCGDQSDAIDFLGYNIYSWCGDSTYEQSGYAARTAQFANYSVPVFFAEYGCNAVTPRTFTDIPTIFGSQMTPVWSGAIVYQYFETANKYGLVNVDGNTVSTLPDFENYSSQINAVSPSGTPSASYTPTNSPASCPPVSGNWSAAATPLPPSPNPQLCNCMYNSLSCVPASNINQTDLGALFNYVCSEQSSVCNGIAHNGTTGTYGAYGMCNSTQQLGFVLNGYYQHEGSNAGACQFSGSATVTSAASATGSCSALLAQASNGSGTVSASPVGTASEAAGSGSGSGSGSSGKTSGKSSAAHMTASPANSGLATMLVMVTLGMVSGMGMILL